MKSESITLQELWQNSKNILSPLYKNNPQDIINLEGRLLLTFACEIKPIDLIVNPKLIIDDKKVKLTYQLLNRLLNGEPIYRIIGHKDFHGLTFKLSKDTLEPRDDTGALIDLASPLIQQLTKDINVSSANKSVAGLEIGCGSGIIAITLLALNREISMTAVDISLAALDTTKENAEHHNVTSRLSLIHSDMFKEVKGKFDFIISNPPYLTELDMQTIEDKVKNFDPHIALYGGKDGLYFYKEIAKQAKEFLTENGYIFVEIGYNQHDDVKNIFTSAGYEFVNHKCDLNGIIRALAFKISSL